MGRPDPTMTMPTLRFRTRARAALAVAVAVPLLAGSPADAQSPPAAKRPAPTRPASGADRGEARELTADQQLRQLLARLTFGARPGDVERVRAIGIDRWIEEQLHPERIDDGALDATLARFPVVAMSGSQLLREFPPDRKSVV